MGAKETLEHTEHISHAGHHGHGHGHGEAHAQPTSPRLGMNVGITIAVLGVILAFCAAKVGGERTELVQTLGEQSNAQAQYHAQDVKHRAAVLNLQSLYATRAASSQPEASALRAPAPGVRAPDVLAMVQTTERYLGESELAKKWSQAYQPAIMSHAKGSERYELAQLLAEIGIVLASMALLLRRRLPWFAAILLGAGSIGVVAVTYVTTSHTTHEAEHKIESTEKAFLAVRSRNKTTGAERQLLVDVRKWVGEAAAQLEKKRP